ncbi:MAG: choice-of-anchor D domain-containing protein [Deltaproteobacteria bacterium]|nr:choice-of-anchor D domain-containing protein [Deltaproteobacteria bacterium]
MTAILALLGCPDQQLTVVTKDSGDVAYEPDIEIEPDALSFADLMPGQEEIQSFTIENRGNVDLHLSNIVLTGTTAFTVGTDQATATIAPGSKITVPVTFTPVNPEDFGTISVFSDDPDSPELPVSLDGTGLVPQLYISPNPYGFGSVMLDCEQTQPITFTNIGSATLTVTQVVITADGFTLGDFATPFYLEAGESSSIDLNFLPSEEIAYGGEMWVASDSLVETSTVSVSGSGTTESEVTDEYWQGDGPWDRTDIFFYVDQSCSMADDRKNMTDNFLDFTEMLAGLDLDWQIAVSTLDSGCSSVGILTPDTPNLETAFLTGVDSYAGRYTEAGLHIATNGMQNSTPGNCNDGFLREDSKPQLVLVSDEPDQSPGSWSSYVSDIQAVAPEASITAIVGDVPSGCATADPGTGYYEAATATRGAFLSICEQDWSTYFDAIATLSSTGATDRFGLSSTPDPVTIVVTVDDDITTEGWTYDAGGNAVVFDEASVPGPGAHVVIDYTILGDCID